MFIRRRRVAVLALYGGKQNTLEMKRYFLFPEEEADLHRLLEELNSLPRDMGWSAAYQVVKVSRWGYVKMLLRNDPWKSGRSA